MYNVYTRNFKQGELRMIKMVAADMDGTSLGTDENISETNIKTIKKVISPITARQARKLKNRILFKP